MFESNPPPILCPADLLPSSLPLSPYPIRVLPFSFKNNTHRFHLVVDAAFEIGIDTSAGVWVASQAYIPKEDWHAN